jgi:AbrB family looped-hinge helix DNA binding protein
MQSSGKNHETFRVRIDPAGRLLIPASTRQRLGMGQGDEVIVEVDESGLRITTAQQALKDVQAYFATIKKPGESIVDELIRERREDAARE